VNRRYEPPTEQRATAGGIGFTGLLAIVFIALKLGGVITWSWWAVLAPIWIPWVVVLCLVAIVVWAAS